MLGCCDFIVTLAMAELSEAVLALGRRSSRTQELAWIYGCASAANLVVHVRAGRTTGTATPANDFSAMNPLSCNYIEPRHMGIVGLNAAAMVDDDHAAVLASPLGQT